MFKHIADPAQLFGQGSFMNKKKSLDEQIDAYENLVREKLVNSLSNDISKRPFFNDLKIEFDRLKTDMLGHITSLKKVVSFLDMAFNKGLLNGDDFDNIDTFCFKQRSFKKSNITNLDDYQKDFLNYKFLFDLSGVFFEKISEYLEKATYYSSADLLTKLKNVDFSKMIKQRPFESDYSEIAKHIATELKSADLLLFSFDKDSKKNQIEKRKNSFLSFRGDAFYMSVFLENMYSTIDIQLNLIEKFTQLKIIIPEELDMFKKLTETLHHKYTELEAQYLIENISFTYKDSGGQEKVLNIGYLKYSQHFLALFHSFSNNLYNCVYEIFEGLEDQQLLDYSNAFESLNQLTFTFNADEVTDAYFDSKIDCFDFSHANIEELKKFIEHLPDNDTVEVDVLKFFFTLFLKRQQQETTYKDEYKAHNSFLSKFNTEYSQYVDKFFPKELMAKVSKLKDASMQSTLTPENIYSCVKFIIQKQFSSVDGFKIESAEFSNPVILNLLKTPLPFHSFSPQQLHAISCCFESLFLEKELAEIADEEEKKKFKINLLKLMFHNNKISKVSNERLKKYMDSGTVCPWLKDMFLDILKNSEKIRDVITQKDPIFSDKLNVLGEDQIFTLIHFCLKALNEFDIEKLGLEKKFNDYLDVIKEDEGDFLRDPFSKYSIFTLDSSICCLLDLCVGSDFKKVSQENFDKFFSDLITRLLSNPEENSQYILFFILCLSQGGKKIKKEKGNIIFSIKHISVLDRQSHITKKPSPFQKFLTLLINEIDAFKITDHTDKVENLKKVSSTDSLNSVVIECPDIVSGEDLANYIENLKSEFIKIQNNLIEMVIHLDCVPDENKIEFIEEIYHRILSTNRNEFKKIVLNQSSNLFDQLYHYKLAQKILAKAHDLDALEVSKFRYLLTYDGYKILSLNTYKRNMTDLITFGLNSQNAQVTVSDSEASEIGDLATLGILKAMNDVEGVPLESQWESILSPLAEYYFLDRADLIAAKTGSGKTLLSQRVDFLFSDLLLFVNSKLPSDFVTKEYGWFISHLVQSVAATKDEDDMGYTILDSYKDQRITDISGKQLFCGDNPHELVKKPFSEGAVSFQRLLELSKLESFKDRVEKIRITVDEFNYFVNFLRKNGDRLSSEMLNVLSSVLESAVRLTATPDEQEIKCEICYELFEKLYDKHEIVPLRENLTSFNSEFFKGAYTSEFTPRLVSLFSKLDEASSNKSAKFKTIEQCKISIKEFSMESLDPGFDEEKKKFLIVDTTLAPNDKLDAYFGKFDLFKINYTNDIGKPMTRMADGNQSDFCVIKDIPVISIYNSDTMTGGDFEADSQDYGDLNIALIYDTFPSESEFLQAIGRARNLTESAKITILYKSGIITEGSTFERFKQKIKDVQLEADTKSREVSQSKRYLKAQKELKKQIIQLFLAYYEKTNTLSTFFRESLLKGFMSGKRYDTILDNLSILTQKKDVFLKSILVQASEKATNVSKTILDSMKDNFVLIDDVDLDENVNKFLSLFSNANSKKDSIKIPSQQILEFSKKHNAEFNMKIRNVFKNSSIVSEFRYYLAECFKEITKQKNQKTKELDSFAKNLSNQDSVTKYFSDKLHNSISEVTGSVKIKQFASSLYVHMKVMKTKCEGDKYSKLISRFVSHTNCPIPDFVVNYIKDKRLKSHEEKIVTFCFSYASALLTNFNCDTYKNVFKDGANFIADIPEAKDYSEFGINGNVNSIFKNIELKLPSFLNSNKLEDVKNITTLNLLIKFNKVFHFYLIFMGEFIYNIVNENITKEQKTHADATRVKDIFSQSNFSVETIKKLCYFFSSNDAAKQEALETAYTQTIKMMEASFNGNEVENASFLEVFNKFNPDILLQQELANILKPSSEKDICDEDTAFPETGYDLAKMVGNVTHRKRTITPRIATSSPIKYSTKEKNDLQNDGTSVERKLFIDTPTNTPKKKTEVKDENVTPSNDLSSILEADLGHEEVKQSDPRQKHTPVRPSSPSPSRLSPNTLNRTVSPATLQTMTQMSKTM